MSTGNKKPKNTQSSSLNCEHCEKVFTRKDNLVRHVRNKHKNNFALDWIKIARNILKTSEKHLTKHGKKDFFQCRCCGIVLRTILNLIITQPPPPVPVVIRPSIDHVGS